jgi:hypothetical protein
MYTVLTSIIYFSAVLMHRNGCHYMSVIIEYVTHFTFKEFVNVSSASHSGNHEQLLFPMSFLGYSIQIKSNIVKKRLFTKERKVVFKEG